MLVIEHDMRVVKGVSDRVIACDYGQKIGEGTLRGGREQRTGDRGLPGHESGGMSADDPSAEPILEMRNVSTHYGLVSVLRNVDIQIYEGEMVCLLGGNASGKTTTLKTILGYVTPSEGEVLLGRRRGERHADDRGRPARASPWCRRTGGCSPA